MLTRVLVPLDRSSLAEQAIAPATAIAKASKGEVVLVMAHRAERHDGSFEIAWLARNRVEETMYIDAVAGRIWGEAGVGARGSVEAGDPVDVICRSATELDA